MGIEPRTTEKSTGNEAKHETFRLTFPGPDSGRPAQVQLTVEFVKGQSEDIPKKGEDNRRKRYRTVTQTTAAANFVGQLAAIFAR